MEHLNQETLARLVDHEPTAEEAAHVTACDGCASEFEALRAQTNALAALPEIMPPQGDWKVLEARLRSEGLVEGPDLFQKIGLARTPSWMRAAAAAVVFLAGTATGATFFGAPPSTAEPPTLAMSEPATLEEAAEELRLAENVFVDRLARYNELFAQGGGEMFSPADAAVRYHALEQLETLGQAAVRQVPHDQVLNGLLAVTRAERETMDRVYQTASLRGDWF